MGALVDFFDLCRDSAIQINLTALAVPSVGFAFLCHDSAVLMQAWHRSRCSIGSRKTE
ncbi:MAG: hypothetical protein IJM81_03030 [Prevotella sp.]|nr:hypothetical protein [Prevotella sp.]